MNIIKLVLTCIKEEENALVLAGINLCNGRQYLADWH